MKKVLLLALIALATGACANKGIVGGPITTVPMLQVGVRVHVVNNCAPKLNLESNGRVEVANIPYGSSAIVPLSSQPFTGSSRQLFLVAKGYTLKDEYLGSQTRQLYVSTHEGTRDEVWEVNYLQLPNRGNGCV